MLGKPNSKQDKLSDQEKKNTCQLQALQLGGGVLSQSWGFFLGVPAASSVNCFQARLGEKVSVPDLTTPLAASPQACPKGEAPAANHSSEKPLHSCLRDQRLLAHLSPTCAQLAPSPASDLVGKKPTKTLLHLTLFFLEYSFSCVFLRSACFSVRCSFSTTLRNRLSSFTINGQTQPLSAPPDVPRASVFQPGSESDPVWLLLGLASSRSFLRPPTG